MGALTTFLSTSPVAMFLIPIILILVVALIVLTAKSHGDETPPVTPLPVSPEPVGSVSATTQNEPVAPAASVVPPPPITPTQVQAEPVVPSVEPVAAVVETPPVTTTPSWRPSVTPVMEEVLAEAKTQELNPSTNEPVPQAASTIPPQTVSKDVVDPIPTLTTLHP